jgi:hypothetical protein
MSSLVPDEVYKFLFRRNISHHVKSDAHSVAGSVSSLGPSSLIPTVYVDFGEFFSTWGNVNARGLLLKQCVTAARASSCRLILVADSSIILPQNLLSQHPCVEWTDDKSSRHAAGAFGSHQVGDLGPLVRTMCEDVLVLRRPIGSCVGISGSRAAAAAVALFSRCSGVIARPSSWLVHAAALAGTPLVPVDFQRRDTSDAFWAAQLHLLRTTPVCMSNPLFHFPVTNVFICGVILNYMFISYHLYDNIGRWNHLFQLSKKTV